MANEAEPGGCFAPGEARRPRDEDRSGLEGGLRALESIAAPGPVGADISGALRQGLRSGRWALVRSYERDGEVYVIARRSPPAVTRCNSLSCREREALGFAIRGVTNKVIAYEMGITASTVGVLLHRAARKLDCQTRGELLARFERELRHG